MARSLWLLIYTLHRLSIAEVPQELHDLRPFEASLRQRNQFDVRFIEAPRLLLFWPVDGSNRTVTQVKKNLEHVKSSLGAKCCDVFLAHYKGDSELFGSAWYKENVVGNLTTSGYKFKFMQRAYNKAQLEEPWESKYDFVWGLDSDVDLTGTNLTKLFRMVQESGALIAGPTFIGAGVNQRHPGGDLRRKTKVHHRAIAKVGQLPVSSSSQSALQLDFDRRNEKHMAVEVSMVKDEELETLGAGDSVTANEETEETDRDAIWRFERPNPNCDYRHTDFVELTAPILTTTALPLIFNDCNNCIHNKSDWGLDMVWCNFLAHEAKQPSSCALIDATPVNHLNWKQALPSKVFYEANREVHRQYRRYWSHFKTLSCVVVEPTMATKKMQELELPQRKELVRKEGSR